MRYAKLTCPECGAPMKLKEGRLGPFYSCTRWPACGGTHSAHGTRARYGEPMGVPADAATRAARARAHDALDRLWKSGLMTRSQAYRELCAALGLAREEGHIGRLTLEQCDRLVAALDAKFP